MRLVKLFGLFLCFLIHSASSAQVFSLADNDCAFPCWMGLIAGESTAADAASLATNALGEFDDNGILINGLYEIQGEQSYTRIEIRAGLVDKMSVMPTHPVWPETDPAISMRTVLQQLGQPNFVHRTSGDEWFNADMIFSFIYLDSRLRVHFYEPRESIHDGFQCEFTSIQDDLYINELYFYSVRAANELLAYRGYPQRYPALLGYPRFETDVPSETWQAIMNGEMDEYCDFIYLPGDTTTDRPIFFGAAGNSLFVEDTCAPPCWMGLTVGESTKADLETFIEEQSGLYVDWQYSGEVAHPSINRKLDGLYWAIPLLYPREDAFFGYYPYWLDVRVDEGIVRTISIAPNRVILLGDVFANYGNPDAIDMNYSDPTGVTHMRFYYLDYGLSLELEATFHCNLNTMSRDFWLTDILYAEDGQIVVNPYQYLLSPELWEKALSHETLSCRGLALEAMRR